MLEGPFTILNVLLRSPRVRRRLRKSAKVVDSFVIDFAPLASHRLGGQLLSFLSILYPFVCTAPRLEHHVPGAVLR